MVRRWCISLTGLALVAGAFTAAGPAVAASTGHGQRGAASTLSRPGARGSRPMFTHSGPHAATTSTNWSGYASKGSTFKNVSASWVEPTGHCTSGDEFSSFWVGLDGFSSSSVEQTGSEVDCQGSKPVYFAWWEMFPNPSVNFSNTVKPGDHFSASVAFEGSGKFKLMITDSTKGWTHTLTKTLASAKRSSAEAIVEAPCCTDSGGILPLADFGTVNFTNVMVNGAAIGNSNPTEIVMNDSSGSDKDSVTTLTGGTAFSATWIRKN